MTEGLLKELRGLEFDSLTAREAVELRTALGEAMAKGDRWMAGLMREFGAPGKLEGNGRPPAATSQLPHPVKPPDPVNPPERRRRGRPVPELRAEFPAKGRKQPEPIAVGGADSGQPGPQAAQIFQDSYVSREGPRPGAALPPDHPRRSLNRESSVTPEVDMSDFHEVEEQMRRSGSLGKIFQ